MSVVAAAAEKQMKTTAKPPPLKRSRLLKRPRRAPQKKNLDGVAIVTTLNLSNIRGRVYVRVRVSVRVIFSIT